MSVPSIHTNSYINSQQGIDIEIKNLTVKVKKTGKTIIDDVSVVFKSGQVNAFMGPSGSGKTTILNILSGQKMNSQLSLKGSYFLNNKNINDIKNFKDLIGFVHQKDLVFDQQTPHEILKFVCDNIYPHKSKDFIDNEINTALKKLDLYSCKDTRVGNQLRKGLSGGQIKRVAIAIEYIQKPQILILDEPTSGLDSTNSSNLMLMLQSLAQNDDINIIVVLHQPSAKIFKLFDNLLLLTQGKCIYQGEPEKSIEYFQEKGYKLHNNQNPLELYMQILLPLNIDDEVESFEDYTSRMEKLYIKNENTIDSFKSFGKQNKNIQN